MSSTSRPPTPSPEEPRRGKERFKERGDPCEWAESYRPGGFHPLVFGDTLKNGCYRVIRKLGNGSYSTVWLAVNNTKPRYVAIKVMMAKYSAPASGNTTTELDIPSVLGEANATNVLTLLDDFQEKGPNGTHTCLVYEPMGGTVASTLEHLVESKESRNFKPHGIMRYPKTLAKRILKHTLLGLDAMHRCEIVHGDLQPGNLLFAARGLDKVDESKLQQDPANITAPLERLDGKKDQWAPEYLAIGQPLHEYADLGPSAEIRISDFGAAFFTKSPPAKIVTPVALRAPETILKQPVNEKIDIWSFGCLVYELVTGSQLFCVTMMGDDKEEDADDDHMLEFNDILGELPDNLMVLWPRSGDWFGPGRERLNPRAVKGKDETDELSPEEFDPNGSEAGDSDDMKPENLSDKFNEEDVCEVDDLDEFSDADMEDFDLDGEVDLFINQPLEALFHEHKPDDIDEDEAAIITSLVRRILKYNPSERPSTAELLQDPWFKGC